MSTADAPVREGERLDYMDILRGFAVLAIFAVNIKAMAMPFGYYMNPTIWPGEHDALIANLQAYIIDNKWRTNFTALFGAGLVLISMKADAAGAKSLGRILLRNSWLLVFGLIHLILIWHGDILTIYALSAYIALWFRNLSARVLGWCMAGMLTLGVVWASLAGMAPAFIPEMAAEMSGMFWGTDPEAVNAEIAAYSGGIGSHIETRLSGAVEFIGFYFFLGGFAPLTIGIMLAGMWLFKLGFYKGEWSAGNYLLLAVIGLALAWGLEALRQDYMEQEGWTFEAASMYMPVWNISGLAGAFGYAALVGWFYRIGVSFPPVAAAGRMAFTNYIACSLIGTTIFYGHAGGLFGQATLAQLMMIVAATWLAILIWSPIWLKYFHFGPLEWVWRSLTYWQVQPFRKARPVREEEEPDMDDEAVPE